MYINIIIGERNKFYHLTYASNIKMNLKRKEQHYGKAINANDLFNSPDYSINRMVSHTLLYASL